MTTQTDPPRLDPAALRELHDSGDGPRLLDVRTPGEFRTARIPGSYNVPLDTLRAERALAEAGLPNLRVLDGGVMAWEAAGGVLTRGPERWGLERQVRLIAGSIVLVTGPAGLLVPGLQLIGTAVGAGLTVAALTCAMGMLLSKLPCNRGPRTDLDTIVTALRGTP